MTNPIRVVLVDDQQLIRMGFRMVLDAEPDIEVVGEAEDGAQGVRMVAAEQPDVVLMDVRMPKVDGIEATRQIVGQYPATRVVVLTTFDLDEYAFAALRAGASGFLLKDAPPEQLLGAITSVFHGDAVIAPSTTKRLLEHLVTPKRSTPSAEYDAELAALATLTAREREVLEAMAEGLSNTEIAAKLFVSATTVKTHVGKVLTKLGARDRVQAVVLAYRTGIV